MGPITKRAAKEAAKLVKLDTVEHAVFLIGGQVVLAALLWVAQDDAGLPVRVASAAIPFMLYPVAFAWKLTRVPGIMLRELTTANAELRSQVQVAEDRKALREWLGVEMEAVRVLMERCADETQPNPNDDAQAWAEGLEAMLLTELDTSYVARFRDSSGVPMQMSSINDDERRRLHAGLRIRRHNLAQFIKELA